MITFGRFHVLEEFDEGKRSCRRRLAGHNKRRRKTHPENVANGASVNDEGGSNYLLISLLRILANVQCKSLYKFHGFPAIYSFCMTKDVGKINKVIAFTQ